MAERGRPRLVPKYTDYGMADIKLGYLKYIKGYNKYIKELEMRYQDKYGNDWKSHFEKANIKTKFTLEQFQNRVEKAKYEYGKKVYTTKQAILRASRTRALFEYKDLARQNLLAGLQSKHPKAYERIKYIMYGKNVIGGQKSIDAFRNLEWNKDLGEYTFKGNDGKEYAIVITNSPDDVEIIQLG